MARSYFDQFVGFHQLWVTDGRKVLHAVASFGQGAIQNLTTIGSRVFFSVQSAAKGVELWTSDGTTAGTVMIKDIISIEKGSGEPNKNKVGKISRAQLKKLAEEKIKDLNCYDVDAAIKILMGSARSMGVTVEGV